MGGQQTRQQTIRFNPTSAGFERIEQPTGAPTWLNRQTGEELEEYQFLSNSQREFQYEVDAFNFRHNNPYLVSSLYLRDEVQNDICGSVYAGNLFLQRIPKRLSNLKEIPFPDVLHLYSQAFKGFDLMQRQVGPFNVTEDMIGINKSGVVKVWFNSDFARSLPERSIDVPGLPEQVMVRRIIELIHHNTYLPSMGNNIRQFFEQRGPATFVDAHVALEEYARLNGLVIPARLDCYIEAFTGPNVVTTTVEQSVIPTAIVNPSLVGARPTSISQTHVIRPSTIVQSQAVVPPVTHSVIPTAGINTSIVRPVVPVSTVAPIIPTSIVAPTIVTPNPTVPVVNTVTNTQRIVNKRPGTNIRLQPTVETHVSRNALPTRSLPIPTTRTPAVGTVSHNVVSSTHLPASTHLNITNPHNRFVSPTNVTPLFPRVSPVRHASIAKPTTGITTTPITTIPHAVPAPIPAVTTTLAENRVGNKVNHLFNRRTLGTNITPRTAEKINFNSAYIKPNLAATKTINEYQSLVGDTNISKPYSFQPTSNIKVQEQVASSNYNNNLSTNKNYNYTSQKTVTEQYEYKPLTSEKITTNYEVTGVTGGISDRIQRLNDKYKQGGSASLHVPSTATFGNANYSSNYVPTNTYNSDITHINTYKTYQPEASLRTVGGTYYPTSGVDIYPITNLPPTNTVGGVDSYVTKTNYEYTHQKTPTSFAEIVRQEIRDVSYAPGEAVQSFAVERFAPSLNTLNVGLNDYTSTFARTQPLNPNLASGYITSPYVPEVNKISESGFLQNYSPYNNTPSDVRYETIREELYEHSPQAFGGGTYGYTSTYTETYQSNNHARGDELGEFGSVYRAGAAPHGLAYIDRTTEAISSAVPVTTTYERQQYYREEASSHFIGNQGGEYRPNIDSDLMSDLQKMRNTGTLGGA